MRSIAGSIIILAGSIILAATFHGFAVSSNGMERQGPVPYLVGGALVLVGFVVTANGFFEGDARR